jgi:excisionase family DNA binding protein
MITHELLDGNSISYEPPPAGELAAFLDRVRAAVDDPTITERALLDLVYGTENPLLDRVQFPGRAVVTLTAYENPIFLVMLDLVGRKGIASGTLDLEAAHARYTMTVAEAAAQLGVTPGAVRQAIGAGKLPSIKKHGVHLLDPETVGAYHVSRRGPKPGGTPLEVRCGSLKTGARLSVKAPRELAGRLKMGDVVTGRAEGWRRIAVLMGNGDKARLFVLEPAASLNEIVFEGFFVRGRFEIVEKDNNPTRARSGFTAFEAE